MKLWDSSQSEKEMQIQRKRKSLVSEGLTCRRTWKRVCVCMCHSWACGLLCQWWHHLHAKLFHTSPFGPAQRHTHFKDRGFGSNAAGAGRWWMYTTLSMAPSPFIRGAFHVFACRSHIDYKTRILMWINELESKWSCSSNKSDDGTRAQTVLDPVPSVIKNEEISRNKQDKAHKNSV